MLCNFAGVCDACGVFNIQRFITYFDFFSYSKKYFIFLNEAPTLVRLQAPEDCLDWVLDIGTDNVCYSLDLKYLQRLMLGAQSPAGAIGRDL
jgi:hypothetical protein